MLAPRTALVRRNSGLPDGPLEVTWLPAGAEALRLGGGWRSLQHALDDVRPAPARVVGKVRDLGPDEIEIGFGLKAGGDSNVITAKGTA